MNKEEHFPGKRQSKFKIPELWGGENENEDATEVVETDMACGRKDQNSNIVSIPTYSLVAFS